MKKQTKLIRVTAVLDYVESKWKEYWWRSVGFEKADKISKDSSEFGTRVHKIVEDYLNGWDVGEHWINNPEQQCAGQIIAWLRDNKVSPLFETYTKSLEVEVSDKKLGLVGHFDMAGIVEGRPCIIDFKTSNKMRKSFPLQKSAYAKMANKQFGVKIDTGITIRSHWDKETKKVEFEVKYYPDLIKNYWPKFKACLDVYKYFQGKE